MALYQIMVPYWIGLALVAGVVGILYFISRIFFRDYKRRKHNDN